MLPRAARCETALPPCRQCKLCNARALLGHPSTYRRMRYVRPQAVPLPPTVANAAMAQASAAEGAHGRWRPQTGTGDLAPGPAQIRVVAYVQAELAQVSARARRGCVALMCRTRRRPLAVPPRVPRSATGRRRERRRLLPQAAARRSEAAWCPPQLFAAGSVWRAGVR